MALSQELPPRQLFSSPAAKGLLVEVSDGPFTGLIPATPSTGSTSRPEADDDGVFEAAKKAKGLGFASPRVGALLIANTLLGGSGMLGIPHALSVAGYGLGLFLMAVFGTASAFGCHLLHCSARRIGQAPCSFYSVSNVVSPSWTWLIDGAVMIKCFGVATSYLIIVGDLAPYALQSFGLTGFRRWHGVTLGFMIGGTLACFKNLSALKYTAAGALTIVFWTAMMIVLFAAQLPGFDPCSGGIGGPLPCANAEFKAFVLHDPIALGKALPVFIFGFTCQQNIFTVCNEVREVSMRRLDRVLIAAYLFSGSAFAIAALLGYMTYGDQVQPDVLKGYPRVFVVHITGLLFSMLAACSYPLQIHPARTSALSLWALAAGPAEPTGRGPLGETVPAGEGQETVRQRCYRSLRFNVLTLVLLAGSFGIAIKVQDLGKILGVVGATGSTMVSYILPGVVYVKTFPVPHAKRTLAFCQLGAGCVIMPVCLVLVLA